MSFQLTSKNLKDGGTLPEAQVYNGFGYSGGNVSPHLAWEGAPAGTKSFVLTMYDPDAPTGSGWWHWVIINLPASVKELSEGSGSGKGALPKGALQTRTDFGAPGYGGAAPPPGSKHRYVFTIHALKIEHLDLDENASAALVGFMTNMNSLGKATLTVTFGK